MRRALLFCAGVALGLAAATILWNGPDLFALVDSWHSATFTRLVGAAVIVEGALSALGAALCLGRGMALAPALTQRGAAGPGPVPATVSGGPVLPICGILFLLAAVGPLGQARDNAMLLEVMDSTPDRWGADLVEEVREVERTARTFAVLWLVVGGGLLSTPLLLKPRCWQMGWRMNGVGCGIAVGGFVLTGMGILVCVGNGLAMEGASKDVNYAGLLAMLAGALVAVAGSTLAVLGKAKP